MTARIPLPRLPSEKPRDEHYRLIQTKSSVVVLDCSGRVVETCPLKEFAGGSFEARLGLMNLAADQKTLAERRWRASTKPTKPQAPCDVGLFSDDRDQLDLVEMFADPANE